MGAVAACVALTIELQHLEKYRPKCAGLVEAVWLVKPWPDVC